MGFCSSRHWRWLVATSPVELLLAIIVGITGIAWFLSRLLSQRTQQHWFWTGAEWVGLLAIAVVALQLVHWSPSTLKKLSPEIDQLLPLHSLVAEVESSSSSEALGLADSNSVEIASGAESAEFEFSETSF